MNYLGKNVLVTGGCGFIGSNLVHDLIKLGAKVTVLDLMVEGSGANKKNLEDVDGKFISIIGDLADSRIAEDVVKNKDIIFHLAGQTSHTISMNDPFLDIDSNLLTTISLLEACKKFNKDVKIVKTSTRQVYGKPEYLPIDEKHPLNPVDVNAVNNIAADMFLMLYNKVHGIKSIILRLTNTYGPRQNMKINSQQVIPVFFRLVMDRKEITIFGDGKQLRDLNYVDDVNNALLIVATSDVDNGIFNLGDDNYKSLLEIAKEIINVNGSGNYRLISFPEERKKIDVGDTYLNTEKIKKEFCWEAKVGLTEGIKRTLDYFRGREEYYF